MQHHHRHGFVTAHRSLTKQDRAFRARHLTVEQRHALARYFNMLADGWAMRLNSWLLPGEPHAVQSHFRPDTPSPSDHRDLRASVLALDGALARAALVIRAGDLPSIGSVFPFLFRGLRASRAFDPAAFFRVGEVVDFAGFMSTSPLLLRAMLYTSEPCACVLRLDMASYGRGGFVYNWREEEVLLPRGLRWIVRSVRRVRPRQWKRAETDLAIHPLQTDENFFDLIPRSCLMVTLECLTRHEHK